MKSDFDPPRPSREPAPRDGIATARAEEAAIWREAKDGELPQEESMEMMVGRIWLVRIGMVVLLTGLVLLGNLAYQQIIPRMGPGAKLGLLAAAGALLGWAGVRMARQGRPGLRHYARVLVAGGTATWYYTAYAAHFVPALRVIGDPLIGGVLLLGVAGVIGWAAHRWRSEPLAALVVLLSYYTSAIHPIGLFTLYSSLLLTGAAVFFLIRHQWTRLSLASLLGTYGSFAYWRFFGGEFESVGQAWVPLLGFLSGYWVLFTVAMLFTRRRDVTHGGRAGFATFNNVAFFALGTHTLALAGSASIWLFAVSFGAVLMILSRWVSGREPEGRAFSQALLVEGVVAFVAGGVMKLTGYQLSLGLGLTGAVLLAGAKPGFWFRSLVGGVCLSAGLMLARTQISEAALYAEVTAEVIAALAVAAGWWWKRRRQPESTRAGVLVLMLMAVVLAGEAIWQQGGGRVMVPAMSVGILSGALLATWGRFPELALALQGLLVLLAGGWGSTFFWEGPEVALMPMAYPLSLLGVAAGLACWWPWHQRVGEGRFSGLVLESGAAVAVLLVSLPWLGHVADGEGWILACSLLAVVVGLLALVLRSTAWLMVSGGFLITAAVSYLAEDSASTWWTGLCPSLGLAAVAGLLHIRERFPLTFRLSMRGVPRGLSFLSLGMLLVWVYRWSPEAWVSLILAAGCVLCARNPFSATVASGGTMLLAVLTWRVVLARYHHLAEPQQLAALLLIAIGTRAAGGGKFGSITARWQPLIAFVTVAGVSWWGLQWGAKYHWQQYATPLVAGMGILWFLIGLGLKERGYRQSGLVLLILAVAKVFLLDVWALSMEGRVLSFLALGLALMLVGYFYNRCASLIRKWL